MKPPPGPLGREDPFQTVCSLQGFRDCGINSSPFSLKLQAQSHNHYFVSAGKIIVTDEDSMYLKVKLSESFIVL